MLTSMMSTLTLRDLLLDASAYVWQHGSTIMDRPLDLSEVFQRAQLMTAQMAAHTCLGEVLFERGYAVPESLREAIKLGLEAGILSNGQAQDLKSLNAAANCAKHQVTPCRGRLGRCKSLPPAGE